MLTPSFELTQNDEVLIVSIRVPYAKVSEVEVHFEDNDFLFYSKPYYLRLNLPGKVQYSGEEPAIKYNLGKKTFTIRAPKAQKGEVFEGLDLITKLLASKKEKKVVSPLIEVIEGTEDTEESDEEFDWSIEQQVPAEDKINNISLTEQQCGFANSYSFAVYELKEEAVELFDLSDPQNKDIQMRKNDRYLAEKENFDDDHYVADLYEDEDIKKIIKYEPLWYAVTDAFSSVCDPDERIRFTSVEMDYLQKLPNKEYLLDKSQVKAAFFGLVDILFAYAYNRRITEGEHTVESGWTINKLSATLCWLETFVSIQEVAKTCVKRSLIYPLFRHFELALTVLEDVKMILLLGRKYTIKCLIDLHKIFRVKDPRYILNDLFITDYIVWMQSKSCSLNKIRSVAEALDKVLLTKGDIDLDLVDVESFAKIAWERHNDKKETEGKGKNPKEKPETEHKKSKNSSENTLCDSMKQLSLATNLKEVSASLPLIQPCSEYDMCSSCSSGSSDSTASTCEDSHSEDSDESDYSLDERYVPSGSDDSPSSTDSDDEETDSDSEDSQDNVTRGAAAGERRR